MRIVHAMAAGADLSHGIAQRVALRSERIASPYVRIDAPGVHLTTRLSGRGVMIIGAIPVSGVSGTRSASLPIQLERRSLGVLSVGLVAAKVLVVVSERAATLRELFVEEIGAQGVRAPAKDQTPGPVRAGGVLDALPGGSRLPVKTGASDFW